MRGSTPYVLRLEMTSPSLFQKGLVSGQGEPEPLSIARGGTQMLHLLVLFHWKAFRIVQIYLRIISESENIKKSRSSADSQH